MKKFYIKLLIVFFGLMMFIGGPIIVHAEPGTITMLNQWLTSGGYIKAASSTAGIWVPSLGSPSSPCIVVGTNGKFSTSTCGAAGSQTPYTSAHDAAGYPITNAGNITATYFTATSTTATSTFKELSFTNATGTNISVTGSSSFSILNVGSLTMPSITNSLLWTNGNGAFNSTSTGLVSAGTGISVTGSRYVIGGALTITNDGVTSISATSPLVNNLSTGAVQLTCPTCSTFTYPFPSAATSTLLTFSGGINVTASSTMSFFNSASSSIGNLLFTAATGSRLSLFSGACNSSTQKPVVDASGVWSCGSDTSGAGGSGLGWASSTIPDTNSIYSTALLNVGVGTTSPYAKLSVVGEIVGAYFTATTTATSTFSGGIQTNLLNITSAIATSTFANGIQISAGCYRDQSGVCISAGAGSSAVGGTGAIQFANGSAFAGDATNLYWNDTLDALGIGTSTPQWPLQIASSTRPQLALSDGIGLNHWTMRNAGGLFFLATSSPSTYATSSLSAFAIDANGQISVQLSGTASTTLHLGRGSVLVPEYQPATSTSITIDFASSSQQLVRIGGSAITISFTNVIPGQKLLLLTCNPGTTAGAVTFSGAMFSGGIQPGNTTAANKCDSWSFFGTAGTSTTKAFLAGMTPGY